VHDVGQHQRLIGDRLVPPTIGGNMADISDDVERLPTYPETMEDFRATATAFSQLTGVLGGFSMTILVLILTFRNHCWLALLPRLQYSC
jgi:hypothetical protein